jgi:hypothetical protein
MTTYKSYVERFNKNRSQKRESSLDAKLSSEKETYTQFLEVQLDRISHSLVQLDTFTERLDSTTQQISEIEEKVTNSSKLVKLLQSFAESQVPFFKKFAIISRKTTTPAPPPASKTSNPPSTPSPLNS